MTKDREKLDDLAYRLLSDLDRVYERANRVGWNADPVETIGQELRIDRMLNDLEAKSVAHELAADRRKVRETRTLFHVSVDQPAIDLRENTVTHGVPWPHHLLYTVRQFVLEAIELTDGDVSVTWERFLDELNRHGLATVFVSGPERTMRINAVRVRLRPGVDRPDIL